MLGGVAWGGGSGMQCCRDEKGKKMIDKLPSWNQSQLPEFSSYAPPGALLVGRCAPEHWRLGTVAI